MDKSNLKELIDRYEAASFTVTRKLNAMIRERMDADLTIDQYSTLRYILNHESCTSSELADMFSVAKSAITAIITRLYDKQLIERVNDAKDRRVIYLTLTQKGAEVCKAAEERIQSLIASYLVHFESSEVNSFIESFEKLARLIQQDERSGGEL